MRKCEQKSANLERLFQCNCPEDEDISGSAQQGEETETDEDEEPHPERNPHPDRLGEGRTGATQESQVCCRGHVRKFWGQQVSCLK